MRLFSNICATYLVRTVLNNETNNPVVMNINYPCACWVSHPINNIIFIIIKILTFLDQSASIAVTVGFDTITDGEEVLV